MSKKQTRKPKPKIFATRSEDYKTIHGSGGYAVLTPHAFHVYVFEQPKHIPDEPSEASIVISGESARLDLDKTFPDHEVRVNGEIVLPISTLGTFADMFQELLRKHGDIVKREKQEEK